ncbi:DUF2263-containing protein [Aureococcus anophagefferens]|nr:DUF2263-containing protein [Aureococcus anophagefferens]
MRGLRRPRPLVAAVAALSVRSASSSCACVAPPADAAAYDVLLAGDATTATYANLTAAVLAGGGLARAANYTFAAGCGTAADLAACLPAWLDATNWTVVHVGAGADDVAAGASTDTYAADVAALGDVLAATNATALAALPASVVVDDVYGAVADKCSTTAGDVPEAQQSIEEVGDEENAFLKFLRVSFVRYYLWLLFDAALVAGGLAPRRARGGSSARTSSARATTTPAPRPRRTTRRTSGPRRTGGNGRPRCAAFAFAGLVLVFAALEVSYYFEAAYDDTDCVPKCPAVPGDLDAYDTLLVGDSADAYADGYCGTSYGLLACVDGWLGATNWSVVHFNWGLHDVAPRLYAEVTDYGGNLDALYGKIRSALGPNGTAIWATTTPVPPSYDPNLRTNADVISANAAAADLFGPTGKVPGARRRWRRVLAARRGAAASAPGDADDYTPLKQGVDPYYGSSRA